MLNGLSIINIELSSMCQKKCYICGRRKMDKDYPEIKMNYGFMDFELLKKIVIQLPIGILVQSHWNGEPLLYPDLKGALQLLNKQIRCFDTNGILLVNRADDIIDNMESLTLSTFENDPEWEEQYNILMKFLSIKKNRKPRVIIRQLGNIGDERLKLYTKTGCMIVNRILHDPMGSFNYTKQTIKPEHGICLEMLYHSAIDRFGNVSICVRLDPQCDARLGNLNKQTLEEIWNGDKRNKWLQHHINGKRELVPLCAKCEFWGIPRG